MSGTLCTFMFLGSALALAEASWIFWGSECFEDRPLIIVKDREGGLNLVSPDKPNSQKTFSATKINCTITHEDLFKTSLCNKMSERFNESRQLNMTAERVARLEGELEMSKRAGSGDLLKSEDILKEMARCGTAKLDMGEWPAFRIGPPCSPKDSPIPGLCTDGMDQDADDEEESGTYIGKQACVHILGAESRALRSICVARTKTIGSPMRRTVCAGQYCTVLGSLPEGVVGL